MKIAHTLFLISVMLSSYLVAGGLQSRVPNDAAMISEITVEAYESGEFEVMSQSDLWVGFNVEFPQAQAADYKGKYIFEIKDKNGYASVSTGLSDTSPSAIFKEKEGKLLVSYKNKTDVTYRVILWRRSIQRY